MCKENIMTWSNDIVLEFIELYREEPVIWDPKHPSHKNRTDVTDAWQRIENAMSIQCTVDELKKKKESLMTAFRMHFNKKKVQPNHQINWFAYTIMESFLGEKYEAEYLKPKSTLNISDSEFYSTDSSIYNTAADSSLRKTVKAKVSSSFKTTDSKYKPASSDTSCFKISSNDTNFDEYELYGQLLAKRLRKLDERQRDVAMHEIDNIMFKAKMQSNRHLGSNSPSQKIEPPVFIAIAQEHQYEV